MIKNLKLIPEPLQRQVFIRLGFSIIFLLFFFLLLIMDNSLYTVLPCAALIAFCVIHAYLLSRRAARGGYVIISGICNEAVYTGLRRRTKSVYLQTEEYLVQIAIKQRLKRVPVGTVLDVYVADNTPVYEKDGAKLLYTYLALDYKGGRRTNGSKSTVSKAERDQDADPEK